MPENDEIPLISEQAVNSTKGDTVEIEGVTVDTTTVGQSDDFPDEHWSDGQVSTTEPDEDHAKPS